MAGCIPEPQVWFGSQFTVHSKLVPSFFPYERRRLAPTTSKVPNASKNNAYLVSLMLGLGHHSPALWLPQGPVGWSGPKEGLVLRMQALFLQVKSQRLLRAQIHRNSRKRPGGCYGHCSPSSSTAANTRESLVGLGKHKTRVSPSTLIVQSQMTWQTAHFCTQQPCKVTEG